MVKVGPFQDDHAIFIVIPGQDLLKRFRQLIQQKLNVELSPRPEANVPLFLQFTAIGASYDTNGPGGITLRPKEEIARKLDTIVKKAREQVGKLIPLHTAQSSMGLAQFVQQFIDDGRFLLNSGYLEIKASDHIHTHTPRVYVGEQWTIDLEELKDMITNNENDHIPEAQKIWDKGTNGPFVDATAPTAVTGRGWGVVMGTSFARGTWTKKSPNCVRQTPLT